MPVSPRQPRAAPAAARHDGTPARGRIGTPFSRAFLGLFALGCGGAAGCGNRPAPAPADTAPSPSVTAPILAATRSDSGPPATGEPVVLSLTSPVSAAPPPPPEPVSTEVPCGAKAPPPWPLTNPSLGAWGEDLHTAPSFGYEQERRAPKMPDAGDYLARIPSRQVEQMDNALLICHVEIYSRNGEEPVFYHYKLGKPNRARPNCFTDWDLFAAPDVLLKFRLRQEHPISLYGPEDHWGFFISVPRVRLAAGDLLEVKLWDRDSTGDSAGANEDDTDYIGYASLRLTGKWPIRLSGPYFTMRCNAMSTSEAESAARRWIAPLDERLRLLEAWKPDPRKWDFGASDSELERGEFSFGKGNFRYVAGFLGWDHPAVVDRRAKVRHITEDEWPKKRKEAAKTLAEQAPTPGKPMSLGPGRGTLVANGVVCQGGSCNLLLELRGAAMAPGSKDWNVQIAGVDDEGDFHHAELTYEGTEPAKPGAAASYRIELGSSARVLWLSSPGGVYTVKVRDPG
jgi:hypothetical protein